MNSISKKEIYDSSEGVHDLTFVILIRNNEDYLPKFFKMMVALENAYQVNFNYLFVENGSVDSSVDLIRDFISTREADVVTLGNTLYLDSLPRVKKMAYLRNCAKRYSLRESDWTILIDSDIYFEVDILSKFFKYELTKNQIGMICAYGVEVVPDKNSDGWLTNHHYYDTYAFVSSNKELFWPNCIFSSCKKCKSTNDIKVQPINLLDVESAFGGFALIKTDIFKNEAVGYGVFDLNGMLSCEHIGFCQNLINFCHKRVCVACDCLVYWDASTFGK